MQPSHQKFGQRKPICNPFRQTHRQAHWSHFPQGTGKLSRVTEGWEQSKVGGEIPGSVPYYFINERHTDRGSDRENSRGTTAVTESKHKYDCLIPRTVGRHALYHFEHWLTWTSLSLPDGSILQPLWLSSLCHTQQLTLWYTTSMDFLQWKRNYMGQWLSQKICGREYVCDCISFYLLVCLDLRAWMLLVYWNYMSVCVCNSVWPIMVWSHWEKRQAQSSVSHSEKQNVILIHSEWDWSWGFSQEHTQTWAHMQAMRREALSKSLIVNYRAFIQLWVILLLTSKHAQPVDLVH